VSPILSAASWIVPPLSGALVGWLVALLGARVMARRLAAGRGRAGREAIGRLVSFGTAWLLDLTVADITRSAAAAGLPGAEAAARGLVERLLASAGRDEAVRRLVAALVDRLSAVRVQDAVESLGVKDGIVTRMLPGLLTPSNREALSGFVASSMAGRAGTLIDDRILDAAASSVAPSFPVIAERVVEWLESPETRAELSAQGRELLPRILEKLNVLQRVLLSAGQFDRRLAEKMPEIVEDTIRSLQAMARNPVQQHRALDLLLGIARDWRDGIGAAGPEAEASRARLTEALGRIVAEALDDAAVHGLGQALDGLMRIWLSRPDLTIGALVQQTTGLDRTGIVDAITDRVIAALGRDETVKAIAAEAAGAMKVALEKAAGIRIGEILGITDENGRKKLDENLTGSLQGLAPALLPVLNRFSKAIGLVGAAIGLVVGLFGLCWGLLYSG
jgi:hypothetical protein